MTYTPTDLAAIRNRLPKPSPSGTAMRQSEADALALLAEVETLRAALVEIAEAAFYYASIPSCKPETKAAGLCNHRDCRLYDAINSPAVQALRDKHETES